MDTYIINQYQSSENARQLFDGLNKNNLNYFENEINNLEDLLYTLKNYHIKNKLFENNEIIEEKEDINICNFIIEFNNILKEIIKAKEKSNKLYKIEKEKENVISQLEEAKKDLEEFIKNIEKNKTEYGNKLRELENKQKTIELDKSKLEEDLKEYNQKQSDLKKERDKFEKEKLEHKNERLKFVKEKEKLEEEKETFKREILDFENKIENERKELKEDKESFEKEKEKFGKDKENLEKLINKLVKDKENFEEEKLEFKKRVDKENEQLKKEKLDFENEMKNEKLNIQNEKVKLKKLKLDFENEMNNERIKINNEKNKLKKLKQDFENEMKNERINIKNEKEAFENEKKQERFIIKKDKQQLEKEKLEFTKQMNDERLIIKKEKQQLEKEKSDLEKEKYNIFIKEGLLNEGQNNKKNINTPKGLLNLGLSCYMNSLLQCLYYIPELRYYFIAKKNSYDDEHPVCKALAEVMYGLRYTENKYFEAREIKNIMGNKNKLFLGVKAGDVKDLYFNLIDSILTELEEDNEEETENEENENKIDLTDKLALFKEAEKENNKNNIINQLLIGYYGTTYYCPKNKNNLSYSFLREYFIIFELEKIKKFCNTNELTIEKCFNYYYRLQEKTSFYCNYCKKVEVGNCYEKIYRPPKILVILLDWGNGKIFKGKVEINQYIDLKICIDEENYDDSTLYKLICTLTHTKSSTPTDHYTARCLTDNDAYYCFNDSYVCQIDENKLFDDEHEPHILFYKRISKEESINIYNNHTLKNKVIKQIDPYKDKEKEKGKQKTKEEK